MWLIYSNIQLLRPLEITTTLLFRPVSASPKWYFPYDFILDIKTTSLIRPLLGSPKGGLNKGILLYILNPSTGKILFTTVAQTNLFLKSGVIICFMSD